MKTNPNSAILVTGAGGYIGSIVVRTLLKKGYKVKALDTFYWGTEPLKDLLEKIELIQADIRQVEPLILKDVETIIHTAGLSNDPMADFNPEANYQINTLATKKLSKMCKANGVRKFIFASSASIYDRKDGGEILQDENTTVQPTAAYSASKLEAEKSILELRDKNFCPVVFRQGTVYGYSPRLRYDLVVNTMVKDALQTKTINVFCKGKQWRPLIDVQDVASAYIAAIESKNNAICGQVFNLLYNNYTMLDLATSIKNVMKSKFKIDVKIKLDNSPKIGRNYKISGEKLRKTFSWKPRRSVETSVEDLIKKILKNKHTDFTHPKYYNIEWMKSLLEIENILSFSKKIF